MVRLRENSAGAIALIADLDGKLGPLENQMEYINGQRTKYHNELKRKRAELSNARKFFEIKFTSKFKPLHQKISTLRKQRYELSSYLHLDVPDSLYKRSVYDYVYGKRHEDGHNIYTTCPPSMLSMARKRLAMGSLINTRLGLDVILAPDMAELIASYMPRGFDDVEENKCLARCINMRRKANNQHETVVALRAMFAARLQLGLVSGMRAVPEVAVHIDSDVILITGDYVNVPDSCEEAMAGWPVLKNTKQNTYIYYDATGHNWLLHHGECTPRVNLCNAYIHSPDGNLPIGSVCWKKCDRCGKFKDVILTITLFERNDGCL